MSDKFWCFTNINYAVASTHCLHRLRPLWVKFRILSTLMFFTLLPMLVMCFAGFRDTHTHTHRSDTVHHVCCCRRLRSSVVTSSSSPHTSVWRTDRNIRKAAGIKEGKGYVVRACDSGTCSHVPFHRLNWTLPPTWTLRPLISFPERQDMTHLIWLLWRRRNTSLHTRMTF